MDAKDKIREELKKAPYSVSELANKLGLSRVYVNKKLSELLAEDLVEKQRLGKSVVYSVREGKTLLNLVLRTEETQEDEILRRIRRTEIFNTEVSESARSIFEYAFPEMLNNAIEHSQSEKIWTKVEIVDGKLKFIVRDFGIGAFRNVKQNFQLETEFDAIREIMKGRNTTAPRAHSGMGIFFTSKVADRLEIKSFDVDFLADNELDDTFIRELQQETEGTEVKFEIKIDSEKSVSEIFQSFSVDPEEGDFDKTEIKVKLYRYGTVYVSRSQARAMLIRLDKFKKIILDFSDVEDVGQAFADEIFRVYKMAHPEIEIEYRNANQAVEFMIKLAKNGIEI